MEAEPSRHAEVYDWTLWQMLDLVTATTNTPLNPLSSPNPRNTPPSLDAHALSTYLHCVSSTLEGDGEIQKDGSRRDNNQKKKQKPKAGTTGDLAA